MTGETYRAVKPDCEYCKVVFEEGGIQVSLCESSGQVVLWDVHYGVSRQRVVTTMEGLVYAYGVTFSPSNMLKVALLLSCGKEN